MTRDEILNWLKVQKTFDIDVNYVDVTPTPPLVYEPGTNLEVLANKQAQILVTHPLGKDVLKGLGDQLKLTGWMLQQGIISLQQFADAMDAYESAINIRVGDIEHRQAASEANVTDLLAKTTEAAGTDGFGPEVIDARNSTIYEQDFATLRAHLDFLESQIAPYVANTSTTATLPVNLGRQVPISVTYYEYALGTEPEGLGTGPYGLGGSVPVDVAAIAVTWPDADTAQVALPVIYKDIVTKGSVTTMADGSWTITNEYKTLRFVADN